jgi:hypothetical protein
MTKTIFTCHTSSRFIYMLPRTGCEASPISGSFFFIKVALILRQAVGSLSTGNPHAAFELGIWRQDFTIHDNIILCSIWIWSCCRVAYPVFRSFWVRTSFAFHLSFPNLLRGYQNILETIAKYSTHSPYFGLL